MAVDVQATVADGRRISGSGSGFVAMATAASVLGLIKGLVVAKVVGIEDFGYYGLVLLIGQYGTYVASWGVLNATVIRVPQAIARGDADVERRESEGLSVLLGACAVTGLLSVVVITAVPFSGAVRGALLLAAVLAVGQALGEYVLILLRVRSALDVLGRMMVVRSAGVLFIGVAAGAVFGYWGVVLAELAALAITVAFARAARLHTLAPRRFSRTVAADLVRFGAPLVAAELLTTAVLSLDRLFVAGALPRELGQYVFAALVVTVWIAVAGVLTQWLTPALLRDYGGGAPATKVWRDGLRVAAMTLAGGAVGLGLLEAAIALVGHAAFPEYGSALTVMPVLYLGGLVGALGFPGVVLQALRPWLMLAASCFGVAVCIAGGVVLTARGAGLASFAWLFVASQAATTGVTLVAARHAARAADGPAGGGVRPAAP